MKPQLVVQDFLGHHNKNLQQSSSRLLKGGSWKKQRVIAIIPSADDIPGKVCLALWSLAFPPNNGVVRMLALGCEVGDAYSTAIENILSHPELSQWEYILTIEHDNCPPPDGVVKLVESMEQHKEFSCISGLYFTKGPEGVAQIWGDPMDMPLNFRPQPPDLTGGLKECNGTGMGFALWRVSLFKDKKLKKPWFETLDGKEGKGVATQDLAFWSDAKKYGYRCAVDCSVKVGHYDKSGAYGPEDTMW